jgi:hypothetical protein
LIGEYVVGTPDSHDFRSWGQYMTPPDRAHEPIDAQVYVSGGLVPFAAGQFVTIAVLALSGLPPIPETAAPTP